MGHGGVTLQLSWTTIRHSTKLKVWSLTLFLEINVPYFDTIEALGYTWIYMHKISEKLLIFYSSTFSRHKFKL